MEKKAKKRRQKKNQNDLIEKVKKFISSYQFLYAAFAILLIVVILLGILVLIKGNERKNSSANMVIPILENGAHSSLSIDLSTLKNKEYNLKVTNYRGKDINENDTNYTISFINESDAEIILTKDNEDKNLMVDQKKTEINEKSLTAGKKKNVTYHIQLKENSTVKENDKITIEIKS